MTTLSRMTAGAASVPATATVAWPVAARRGGGPCTLTIRIDNQTAIAVVNADGVESELARALTMFTHADGLVHVFAPGVLTATFQGSGAELVLLYARTPLIESLGVPGGSADRPELLAEHAQRSGAA